MVNVLQSSHGSGNAVSQWNLRYLLVLVYTYVTDAINVSAFAQRKQGNID